MKKLFPLLGALFLLAAPLGARGGEPLRLAALAARTGDAAVSSLAMYQAVHFAVDEINAAGGLLDQQVEVVEFDSQSTALGSRQAAREAVAAGVLAVIGATWSSHSLAAAPVLQEAGVPMISPISTHPDVTRLGDCIFRVCFTDPFQGSVMARFAREDLKAATAVTLVNVSRTYSMSLADVFQENFTRLGGRIAWRGEFLADAANFGEILETVRRLAPDVIFLPGDYRDSAFIIGQTRNMGIQSLILGGDGFGPRLYDYIGSLADGCFYTTHWSRESPLPRSRAFIRRWEEKNGELRQTTIPLAYDAVMVLADAVRRAGSLDRKKVRAALAATRDFPGVTGSLSFDENGDAVKPVMIEKLGNGKANFIRAVEPPSPVVPAAVR
ncbi:MAG: ABC transporter substrate-binding protein [Proteobacteria bacterium]|nr:ABC transporter substrate-binding protein [Pseudomonadota bacterium]